MSTLLLYLFQGYIYGIFLFLSILAQIEREKKKFQLYSYNFLISIV